MGSKFGMKNSPMPFPPSRLRENESHSPSRVGGLQCDTHLEIILAAFCFVLFFGSVWPCTFIWISWQLVTRLVLVAVSSHQFPSHCSVVFPVRGVRCSRCSRVSSGERVRGWEWRFISGFAPCGCEVLFLLLVSKDSLDPSICFCISKMGHNTGNTCSSKPGGNDLGKGPLTTVPTVRCHRCASFSRCCRAGLRPNLGTGAWKAFLAKSYVPTFPAAFLPWFWSCVWKE